MTAAAALSRVERAKENVRETSARLAAEEARKRKNRAKIQRLRVSLAFAKGAALAEARRAVWVAEGEL